MLVAGLTIKAHYIFDKNHVRTLSLHTISAPPEEFAETIKLTQEKGNAAGAQAIMDVNLLRTWSLMRDRSAPQWDAAQEKATAVLKARRADAPAERTGAAAAEQNADEIIAPVTNENTSSGPAIEQGKPAAEQ
jgi:bisphosphoglycerate-independent phosphoglycerate mutase (AlkP superfamily)